MTSTRIVLFVNTANHTHKDTHDISDGIIGRLINQEPICFAVLQTNLVYISINLF